MQYIEMNQQCKVCGEPAAGFHFGAFTCEGCKSFFGRSYNNLSSISECKNNGECVINKKNRTACKACRLRKCLLVGMSKSGSRYGRRSNWFKIHCLLQEQQQAAAHAAHQAQQAHGTVSSPGTSPRSPTGTPRKSPPPHITSGLNLGLLVPPQFPHGPLMPHLPRTKGERLLLGLDDMKHPNASPSVSSPESHNSDSSVDIGDRRAAPMPFFPSLLPPHFLPPPGLLFPGTHAPGYHLYPGLLQVAAEALNNNIKLHPSHDLNQQVFSKRVFLDAVLQSQRTPSPPPVQDDPMDLSVKSGTIGDSRTGSRGGSERGSSPSMRSDGTRCSIGDASDADREDSECSDEESEYKRIKLIRTPLDLTTKV